MYTLRFRLCIILVKFELFEDNFSVLFNHFLQFKFKYQIKPINMPFVDKHHQQNTRPYVPTCNWVHWHHIWNTTRFNACIDRITHSNESRPSFTIINILHIYISMYTLVEQPLYGYVPLQAAEFNLWVEIRRIRLLLGYCCWTRNSFTKKTTVMSSVGQKKASNHTLTHPHTIIQPQMEDDTLK